LVTADDLKAAIHDVLSHNNLFDTGYLSDRLGIGLRIYRDGADGDRTSYTGTATRSPPALYGLISYDANVDVARQVSTVSMTFASRSCAPLRVWGSEWHIETRKGMATHGGPSSESLVWPENNGITLQVTYGPNACLFGLLQELGRVVSMPVSPVGPRAPAGGLSGQIADLLLSDLRNYTEVGHILKTEFDVEPESQRNGLLYQGSTGPDRVIFGFQSNIFHYYGDDSGWYKPPSYFAQPLHLGDRRVTLILTPDNDMVCLSQAQLASDLKHRSRRIRKQGGESDDESIYSVRGANLVSVSVAFHEGCATDLRFRQITDVAHSLGEPIRFTLNDSLDRSNGNLTNEAQRRIKVLAFRLQSVSLRGIEIMEMPFPLPMDNDVHRLKLLISEALKRKNIAALPEANGEHQPGFSDEVGECSIRPQPEGLAVCVDVWQ
jgi:hypothetical protein